MPVLRRVLIFLVECLICGYRVIVAPLLIGNCKFVPSCSEYCLQAVHTHGPWRGMWLAMKRLARCHPFSMGGIDPVPPPACSSGQPSARSSHHHP
ncbi:MAG TPA: membrane protein insertion efficiency factor YidD [Phycisphaerae bacterium]|nr:membrane protein insertion efficiency factor YidD [Phycisphaerae bacterium]HRY69511.1 membrane protein insertion efficiency factor YidD [Phycisphaerae bacterium]HSA28185.1 membrane protein insertion efficiency factor YidD [Phycisphaerae bacterium]